jgi:hypothetical protein
MKPTILGAVGDRRRLGSGADGASQRGLRELAASPATPALVVVIDAHAELVICCGKPAVDAIELLAKHGRRPGSP